MQRYYKMIERTKNTNFTFVDIYHDEDVTFMTKVKRKLNNLVFKSNAPWLCGSDWNKYGTVTLNMETIDNSIEVEEDFCGLHADCCHRLYKFLLAVHEDAVLDNITINVHRETPNSIDYVIKEIQIR